MSPTHILVFFAICSHSIYADAPIDTEDRAVLEVLYHATNGPSWIRLSDWNFTSTNCIDFFDSTFNRGAVCNSTTGRVIELVLWSNNLNGTLPSDLGNLNELTVLRLAFNYLSGDIPNALGNLTKLTFLDLSSNHLTGKIPNQLGNLVELNDLYLNFNDLTGQIPNYLANFSGVLILSFNCFSCPHPFSCDDLVDISTCILGDCGDCCQVYLPAPPVNEGDCIDSSCTEFGCGGCPISCKNSTVVLTCVNSVWRGSIEEDYMCIQEDSCYPNACFNGGSCVNDTDGFHCICGDGFAGTACETNIVCANITCLNGGTHLHSHVESRCCCCAPGFSGIRCENGEGIICDSNPCLNGGTCTTENTTEDNDFTCMCKDGYEGKTCGIDIDECANDPCVNDGVCHDQQNSFSCCCKGGFAGDNCELKPCKQPYYSDQFGKTVKRELDNCAHSDLIKAKKERYDKLIAKRLNEERYTTLIHVAYIAGPTLIGAAIGFAFVKLVGRR